MQKRYGSQNPVIAVGFTEIHLMKNNMAIVIISPERP